MGSMGLGHGVGVVAIMASCFAVGCAHKDVAPPPISPPIAQTTTTSAPTANTNKNVVVSDELAKACKIDFDNEATAPKFDFDESEVRPGDRTVLDQVARCVSTGPLKGRALHLVGRADPRGEQEYNMVLGSSRASAVARYLNALGVPTSQITQSSRGKLDATGTDDASWQLDRRVDID